MSHISHKQKQEKEMPEPSSVIANPLKSWKHFQPNFLQPVLMRGLFAICIFIGFSIFCFCLFPNLNLLIECPKGNRTCLRTSYKEFIATNHQSETNISHVLFGIGGSAETWINRRHYIDLWWMPNVTRGYVWLDQKPGPELQPWPDTSPAYRVSADTSNFTYTCSYGSRSALRIARIVKESFDLGLKNVRWFVMGDDDTVFFVDNLLGVLNKYDHNEMYYIGGNSESVEQDVIHSYTMAYGGGGFAISYPLAAELVKVLDGCIDRYHWFYGSDERIGACMAEIGVPLTKELGFHQIDVRGNPYGLLSAHPLAPLVSLHHLDYVQALFPDHNRIESVKMLVDVYKTNPRRILQHTFCYDLTRNWSISISWGYNVQLYPYLVSAKDLNTPLQTFLTWRTWSQEPFSFNTRALSLNPCERPVVHFLSGVNEFRSENRTITSYQYMNSDNRQYCDREDYKAAYSVLGFNVSSQVLDPRIWTKETRRQCCEIVNNKESEGNIVHVRIRSCNRGESVTPP